MNRGNIRCLNSGFELAQRPTYEQRETLRRFIAEHSDEPIYIDFAAPDGRTEHSVTYEGEEPSRILGDITRYYIDGIKPEGTDPDFRWSIHGDYYRDKRRYQDSQTNPNAAFYFKNNSMKLGNLSKLYRQFDIDPDLVVTMPRRHYHDIQEPTTSNNAKSTPHGLKDTTIENALKKIDNPIMVFFDPTHNEHPSAMQILTDEYVFEDKRKKPIVVVIKPFAATEYDNGKHVGIPAMSIYPLRDPARLEIAARKNEILYVDNKKVSQNKNALGSLSNRAFTPADFKRILARYRRLGKNFIDQNRQFYKDHGYDEKLDKEFKFYNGLELVYWQT